MPRGSEVFPLHQDENTPLAGVMFFLTPVRPRWRKRQRALQELVDTEASYCSALRAVGELYIAPLTAASRGDQGAPTVKVI